MKKKREHLTRELHTARVLLALQPSKHRQLVEAVNRRGVTLSDFIREAIAKELRREARREKEAAI